MTPTEKTCTKCGETKPLDEFYKRSGGRQGARVAHCRDCLKAYRVANAERRRRYERERRNRLAEEIREYDRRRYAANPDAKRARSAAWRRANPERLREWREAFRDRARTYSRDYAEANPHVVWRNSYRARALAFHHAPTVEDFTKADVIERYGDSCFYCETGEFEQLDHFVPVKDGGPHTLDNVRPSCAACNLAKKDADPDEWLAEQAELDDLTEDELDDLIDAEIERWTK